MLVSDFILIQCVLVTVTPTTQVNRRSVPADGEALSTPFVGTPRKDVRRATGGSRRVRRSADPAFVVVAVVQT